MRPRGEKIQDSAFHTVHRFSGTHVLQERDTSGAGSFFDGDLLAFFEARQTPCVEGAYYDAVYYRPGKRARPKDLRTFFASSFEVYSMLRERSREGSSKEGAAVAV